MDLTASGDHGDPVRIYSAGRCGGGQPLDALDRAALAEGEFAWVMLGDNDHRALASVASTLGFVPRGDRPSTAAVLRSGRQTNGVVVTIRVPEQRGDRLGAYSVTAYVGRRYVVTTAAIRPEGWQAFRGRLEADPRQLRHGPDYLLHALLDDAVDQCLTCATRLEEAATAFEMRAAARELSRNELREMMTLQHDLISLGRTIGQNRTIAEALIAERLPAIDAAVVPYLRDVLDHARRAREVLQGSQAVLAGLGDLSAAPAAEAERTVRRLAAWAVMLAVLTAFTALFSMMFPGIPGIGSRFGYPAFLVATGGFCAVIFYRFRRARWV